MLPANERFRAVQHALRPANIELRLIIHRKLLLPNGGLEALQKLFHPQLFLIHGVVIEADFFGKAVFYLIRRLLGAVKAALYIDASVNLGIYPHPDTDLIAPDHLHRCLLQDVFIIRTMRAIDEKGIRSPPADNPVGSVNHVQKPRRHAFQHLIAEVSAVPLVQQVKMINVQHDCVGLHRGVESVKLGRIPKKILLVVQARQMIAFRPADDVPVFKKFDCPQDARQNDLLLGIRFRDKVDRSEVEAFHFRILVGCHHDDRQLGVEVL